MKTKFFILLALVSGCCSAGVMVIPSSPAKGSSSITTTPGPTDTIAWYKFDNDLTDASGTGNGLTGNNSPTFTTGQDGIATHAISFDGTTQSAEKISPVSLPTGDVSFTAWIYNNSSATANRTIACFSSNFGGSANFLDFDLGGTSATSLELLMFQSGSFSFAQSVSAIPINTWVFVTAIFHASAGTADLYVNGVIDHSGVTMAPGLPSGMNVLVVGAVDQNTGTFANWFSGNLDDVRIFARAITSTEVANLYTGQAAWYRARPDFYLAFQPTPNLP